MISWVNDNGYECAGPMFNIYHVSPHETQNPDEYVTEVCTTDSWGQKVIRFYDPDGNLIEGGTPV